MARFGSRGSEPPADDLRTTDLLGALSLAADLGVGLSLGHAVRACYLGMRIADRLGLSPEQRTGLYYTELLMDAGCTAWTSQLAAALMGDEIMARRNLIFHRDGNNPLDVLRWLADYMAVGAPVPTRVQRSMDFAIHGREFAREGFRNTCEVAQRFAARLGMPAATQTALLSIFEQWDGKGPSGRRGEQIPIISRIVYATSFLEVFHRVGGRAAASRLAKARRGTAFDPAVVDAFQRLAAEAAFWEELEQESIWAVVQALEPESPHRYLGAEKLEEIALAFADFADLKSSYSAGHGRRVATLAERIARRLRLPDEEVALVRRAALMHDLGLVAVPSFTLDKPREQLTAVEWERLRLHPYHAERLLARVPALAPAVALIGAHHERPDGQGYYRGLSGAQIPLGARIIAAADCFDELCHDQPGRLALEPETALQQLGVEAGRGLCIDALHALTQELGAPPPAVARGRSKGPERGWPVGLTDREVEILRLLARGLSRRQMAAQLSLSEHTVRHHLEHIYNRIGVGTRVAATLFAVEHDLLR